MEPVTLYDGTVEVKFNPGNHRYTVNGEAKPGVTSILSTINKPLLLEWSAYMASEFFKTEVARALGEGKKIDDKWLKETTAQAKKAHTRHSDTAKDLGHEVHSGIEMYLSGKPYAFGSREVERLINGFIDWHKASGFTTLGTEQVIYSKELEVAGTFDVLFERDGKLYLGDVKTTKRSYQAQQGLYTEYVAQLGGYALAYEEETGKKIDELFVINPDKTYGEIQFVTLSELGITVQDAKNAFIDVYKLWSALRPLEFKIKQQNTLKKSLWYMKEPINE